MKQSAKRAPSCPTGPPSQKRTQKRAGPARSKKARKGPSKSKRSCHCKRSTTTQMWHTKSDCRVGGKSQKQSEYDARRPKRMQRRWPTRQATNTTPPRTTHRPSTIIQDTPCPPHHASHTPNTAHTEAIREFHS